MKVVHLPSKFLAICGQYLVFIFICSAFTACQDDQPTNTTGQEMATRLYVEEVARAANHLIEVTDETWRDSLVFNFQDTARTMGKVTNQTPSFCAVLSWCLPGWGIPQEDMSHDQLVAMHKLLNLALSPGGYQTLIAVQNRQRIIGEMEDKGDYLSVQKALEHHHPHRHVHSVFELDGIDEAENFYPILGGASPSDPVTVNWVWKSTPGLKTRKEQFDKYTMAIFGNPGTVSEWGFRFEGHHITVNMTFVPDPETGEMQVYTTPLFFGAFPMIIPEAPPKDTSIILEWNWEEGQLMMYSIAYHLRQFWLAVPKALREQAFISSDSFPQDKDTALIVDTSLPWLISAVDTSVDTTKIGKYPHINITTDKLSSKALWHLKQAYGYYTNAMNPNVSVNYLERIEKGLAPGQPLTLSWAGESLDNTGSHHYSYLVVGSLLMEFMQNNQFTVQHDKDVTGNHIHSMLRDLSFDWLDPMETHQRTGHSLPK